MIPTSTWLRIWFLTTTQTPDTKTFNSTLVKKLTTFVARADKSLGVIPDLCRLLQNIETEEALVHPSKQYWPRLIGRPSATVIHPFHWSHIQCSEGDWASFALALTTWDMKIMFSFLRKYWRRGNMSAMLLLTRGVTKMRPAVWYIFVFVKILVASILVT